MKRNGVGRMADTETSQHPSTMAPPGTWIRLLWENGGVAPAYWGKLARILLITTLASPLRLAEWLRYGRQVAYTKIDPQPLFILGFARSGTTHLHNLLQHDSRYGVVSTFQTVVPTFFLIGRGWLKRQMAKSLPATRPMDNVRVSLDAPVEEEVAVSNTCALSLLHHLSFPQRSREYWDKYLTMQGLTQQELARWEQVYLDTLCKATLANGGRPLVLKSPNNTGRIPHLLRLFPEAKFVHIVRNPYVVYQSMRHMYQKTLPLFQLQDMAIEDMEEHILYAYRITMQHYLHDRALIPKGNLAEVRYEDLEQKPLVELERLYAELVLPGWEEAKGPIRVYLHTLAGYQKNRLQLAPAAIERIKEEWKFALDLWPYQPSA